MIIIYFIFGLIIGSFLNAVIYRLWVEKPITVDRSICPHCKHVLGGMDLIPVFSFIFLKGKCRYCHKKISWQYPLVELITAISFVLVGLKFSFNFSGFEFWFQLAFVCFFILIAVFDLKHYLILDKVVFPAVALAFIYQLIQSYKVSDFGWHSPIIQGLVGVAIVSGFFALQYFISDGRWIGFGDVKLGIFLGLIFGLGQSLMLLFVSYCLGAVVGLALIALGYKQLGSRLPFGTILGFSAIIILLYGQGIASWYLGLLLGK